MSQHRRALLLAIADYHPADPLPYVRGDLPRMRRALDLMGVPAANIEAHGPGVEGARDLTTNRLRTLIQNFLNGAAEAEDLIVYFSGHGIEQDGHRLLVPQDYDIDYPLRASEMVSDIDIFAWARRSKAASVLVLIDACREGASLILAPEEGSTKSLGAKASRPQGVSSNDVPTIAIVFSCGSRQRSGREREKSGCSAFTRAFAEALEAEDEYGKLTDVIEIAQERLNEFAVVDQKITLGELRAQGRRGGAEILVVKESQAAQFRDRLENSAWVRRLRELKPWQSIDAAAPTLATQVAAIVLRAENQVGKAIEALPQQRWRASDAPFRMLDRINDHLLGHTGIEPAEGAVLLTVPFVYEVVLAESEVRLSAEGPLLDPLSGEERTTASRFWRAWRTACLNDESGERQIERLKERAKTEAAEDVATWRLIAFCHQAGELWDPSDATMPHSGWVTDQVEELVAAVPLGEVRADTRVEGIITAHRLLRFARLMFAAFEDVTLDLSGRTASGLEQDARFGEGAAELRLDEVKVVHLLNIGGRLALDARRLPPVLAEHFGSDDDLTLKGVQDALAATEWHARDKALALGLTCPHEALDAALREVVDDLDAYRRRLLDAGDRQRQWLDNIPTTFNAKDLKPETHQGKPIYDQEHLRFALDQGRVMGLLMGKQLYGDPDLALRELYQNALDACRYRRAHEAYVQKTQQGSNYTAGYQGRIVFRFAREPSGRRFIECLDNGIGMAHRHLRRLFAKAGQRFTDSHEYHLDKARWETMGIAFFPNSRFGIGVLSYFMLAEELEVESQRVSLPDAPVPERIHARVLGSGSLFRLDDEASGAVVGGGTRVRLYLEDQQRPLDQYRDSILSWLWLPEFRTFLEVEGTAPIELLPERPTPEFEEKMGPLIPITGSEGATGTARAFWCLKQDELTGILLADGIRTASGAQGRFSVRIRGSTLPIPAGTAINLTEELRADLSVDRREILSAREGLEFLRERVTTSGWRSLSQWAEPQLDMLLYLLRSCPFAICRLSEAMRTGDVKLPNIAVGNDGAQRHPAKAGLCDVDKIVWRGFRQDNSWTLFADAQVSPALSRLLSTRIAELTSLGVDLPFWGKLLGEFVRQRSTDCCYPINNMAPFATAARAEHVRIDQSRVGPAPLPLIELILCAAWWRVASAELNDVLTIIGLSMVDPDVVATYKAVNERQLKLLSRNSTGEPPFLGTLDLGHMIKTASQWAVPLSDIAALAEPLRRIGLAIPDPKVWQRYDSLSHDQLVLISRGLDGLPPFVEELRITQLLAAAARRNLPLAEVVARAETLARVGFLIPSSEALAAASALNDDQKRVLSNDLDGQAPFVGDLGLRHVLKAALHLKRPLAEIAGIVETLKPLGISVPSAEALAKCTLLKEQHLVLMSRDFDGLPPFVDFLDVGHVLAASRRCGLSLSEIRDLAAPLELFGFTSPDFNLVEINSTPDQQAVRLLSLAAEEGGAPWNRSLALPALARVARDNNISLDEALRILAPVLPLFPERRDQLAQIKISRATEILLLRVYEDEEYGFESLSCWDFAGAAEQLNVPISSLTIELEALETLGIDITECRAFAEFCAVNEARF